jgi:hypothetical protein
MPIARAVYGEDRPCIFFVYSKKSTGFQQSPNNHHLLKNLVKRRESLRGKEYIHHPIAENYLLKMGQHFFGRRKGFFYLLS